MNVHANAVGHGGPPEGSAGSGVGCVAAPEQRSRRGKVARLPLGVRSELNQRLQDGKKFSDICAWVNGLPEAVEVLKRHFGGEPVNEDNITRWRQGGYLDWEDEQRMKEAVSMLSDEFGEIQQAAQKDLSHRMAVVLTAKLAVELQGYGSLPEGPRKSALWERILRGVVVLRRGDLHAERLRAERERFDLRRFRSEAEMRESFFAWMQRGENLRLVKERVAEIEGAGRKQRLSQAEIRRRVRAKLGVP